MGDNDGFDPCECSWNHEISMCRLLSMLRNSQNDCTDTECYQTGLPGEESAPADPFNYTFAIFMVTIYLVIQMLYVRREMNPPGARKPRDNFRGNPPTPPPTNF